MLVQEYYETLPDGKELIRTYSDQNKYIQNIRTLALYEEAVDIVPVPEYFETDTDIEHETDATGLVE